MKDKKIGSTLVNQHEIIFYNLGGRNCQSSSDILKIAWQKRGTTKLFLTILNCCHDCNGEYMQNKKAYTLRLASSLGSS